MCNFCCKHIESSVHIFFECDFAIQLWSWLANCLDLTLQFTSMEDLWKITELNRSPQCRVTITTAIINLINTIWQVKNHAKFDNIRINLNAAISRIIAGTSLSGNNTKKVASNSIRDFIILKKFNVNIHNPKVSTVKEIVWQPPLLNCVKCNIDGASKGNPGLSSCSGIFRNNDVDILLCFAEPLGFASSYLAELQGALRAIEVAHQMNWKNLWIEIDSVLVVLAFKNPDIHVAWSLRNRWHNAQVLLRQKKIIVSHIFREGNQVVDCLANHGLSLNSIMVCHEMPLFIKDSFEKNKLGLAHYKTSFV
ncbi:hypothetical protein QL285_089371 [Trifolium repens]|nr:hypothetical protein QL285_089371 [Trifolium repens]